MLCLVPGAAQVDLGRAGRGLLFFSTFALLANGALLARILVSDGAWWLACALVAAGVWIVAGFDAARAAGRQEQESSSSGEQVNHDQVSES